MNIIVSPHPLRGAVRVPPSKSFAHRLLIAAALADAPSFIHITDFSEDILATARCLIALGAQIEHCDEGVRIHPIAEGCENASLDCGESGSTLRFLLPVAAVLGRTCVFTGSGRLPERPNAVLVDALNAHGASADSDRLPIRLSGRLHAGTFALPGDVSSQYITGLMFSLPLLREDSEIALTSPLESAPYVDATLETLNQFGVCIQKTAYGWKVPGRQRYHSPGILDVEGDWSSAAFWIAANRLGSNVSCTALNDRSVQGDRAIDQLLRSCGGTIDVSVTPDLAPVLAVAAAAFPGQTEICGARRLRLKESDRLEAIARMLSALGIQTGVRADGMTIFGGRLRGGTVDGCGDHRIVMAAAIAATACESPVVIRGAEAVAKSYPKFFDDFIALGGIIDVKHDR